METKPLLIIVLGLPGTGKSTFAKALAKKIKAAHLNTDKIRARLGLRGKYDQETKSMIYQQMLSLARMKLKDNHQVIIDGTFSSNEWRKKILGLADEFSCMISWFVMEADEAIIQERISKKRQYSEADFSVYKKVRNSYDPILYPNLVLHSDRYSVDEMIEKALNYLKRSDINY